MTNKTMIAKAVKYALYSGLAASMAVAAPATFAAEDEEEAEKIVVTGSRIKRVDVETAQPVTVISREDIDLSGDTSVSEALRSQSANSFGSWKGQSGYGSGATGASEIDLRGVGATLVLIDGRRMPGSGYDGGATQDLNNIPLAVVERIEILRGGASAIYGSDAIAGVVNIITRKDVDGVTMSALYEDPKVEGGEKRQYEFSAGVTGERGSAWIVAEHQSQNEIADNAVTGFDNGVSWYSAVPNAEWWSQSSWQSNFNAWDGTQTDADGNPYLDATAYADDQNNYVVGYDAASCGSVANTVDQGYRCGYAYSNVTWLYPQRDSNSIMTKFNYALTDSIDFDARLSYVNTETHSRYAPTPISTSTLTMQWDNPNNPYGADMDPNVDPNTYLYFRTGLLGNRDALFSKSSYDATFGLSGFTESGFDWTLNYQRTLSDEVLFNYNLINDVTIQRAIDDGDFDVLNASGMTSAEWADHALSNFELAAHTGIYQVEQDRNIVDGTFGGEFFSNDTLSAAFVVGAEFEDLAYTQISDPESGQGFISGGSGGDDVFADRDRSALFTEFNLAFEFGLELSAALRYDKYEQEGDVGIGTASRDFSDSTPQFGIAYRPTDNLLLRTTYGEAFRAPTMSELFKSRSFGFPDGYDYYYCDTLGNPGNDIAYCDATNQPQHLTYFGGNPSLEPENADTLTAGVVWNATDNLVFELGYYDLEYYDKIVDVSLNDILLLDQAQGGTSANVTRGSDGQIVSIQSGSVNLARQETSGIDFAFAYNMDSSVGQWNFKGDATYVLDYGFVQDGTFVDQVGDFDYPELKANITTSWSNGDFFAAWRINYIGAQDAPSAAFTDIDGTMYNHIQFGTYLPWDAKVVLGARNVFDEETQYYTGQEGWRNFNTTLYDPAGRTWFVKYEQSL